MTKELSDCAVRNTEMEENLKPRHLTLKGALSTGQPHFSLVGKAIFQAAGDISQMPLAQRSDDDCSSRGEWLRAEHRKTLHVVKMKWTSVQVSVNVGRIMPNFYLIARRFPILLSNECSRIYFKKRKNKSCISTSGFALIPPFLDLSEQETSHSCEGKTPACGVMLPREAISSDYKEVGRCSARLLLVLIKPKLFKTSHGSLLFELILCGLFLFNDLKMFHVFKH